MKNAVMLAALAALSLSARIVDAGCGCDKPPPRVAAVRPAFASPGGTVTLFNPALTDGVMYKVKFRNGSYDTAVLTYAQSKRDFADGVVKVQLAVAAPALPPGPTRIAVQYKTPSGWQRLFEIDDKEFTMLQRPLPLAEIDGEIRANCYSAGVSAENTVYIPVDVTGVTQRLIFSGLAESYPLLFGAGDIAIYNTQGVLMQLLTPDNTAIYDITDPGVPNSFELTYDRHEFLTYKLEHVHEGVRALDPTDPAWHMDGTRHIDHDHLVVAIHGEVENQGPPPPGVTPPFNLHVATAHADATVVLPAVTIQWSNNCAAASNSGPGSSS